jgi:hypothetical protein
MRLRKLLLVLILFAVPRNISAKVELFGFYEPRLIVTARSDESFQIVLNKLRIDLKTEYNGLLFVGNYNIFQVEGETKQNLLDFIPSDIAEQVPEASRSIFEIEFENELELDNAYGRLPFGPMDLIIGKQQIAIGTGYVWNPTDVFNERDPVDPTYFIPGVNAYRLNVFLGVRTGLDLIYQPEDNFETSGKQFRFKSGIGRFDYTLIAVENQLVLTDFTTFTELSSKRWLAGGDFVGEWLGLGVWGEYGYDFVKDGDDYYELIAGVNYTFYSGLFFLLQYYRNTEGEDNYKNYDLNDWLRFVTGETRSLSQDQAYNFWSYPITELMTIGNAFIVSITDGSVAIIPSLEYSVFENIDFALFLNFYTGKEGTAYSYRLGSGGFARLQIFF